MSTIAIQSPDGISKQQLFSSVVQSQTCVSCHRFSSSVDMSHSFKEVCLCGEGEGGGGEEKLARVQELFSQQIFSPEFDSGVHC